MRWLIRATTSLMLLVVTVWGVGALLLPDEQRVERSVEVAASPAAVFTVVNDLRNFNAFSPWASLDPAATYRFSGPQRGVGAAMSWRSSDPQVGNGSRVIVASDPNRRVRMRLQYGESNTAMTEILIEPADRGTRVTWALETDFEGSIPRRYFGALMLDSIVGSDYERGLANLKTLLEQGA